MYGMVYYIASLFVIQALNSWVLTLQREIKGKTRVEESETNTLLQFTKYILDFEVYQNQASWVRMDEQEITSGNYCNIEMDGLRQMSMLGILDLKSE